MRRYPALLGIAAASILATVVSAAAQQPPPARVGVLECTGGPSVGYLVGSTTDLTCVLSRGGRRLEHYVARINRFGVDVGVTDRWVMAWNVLAPTPRLPRGALAGNYGGAGASASVGVGAASNALIGGPGDSISLEPLPVQGQQGLNLAFGFEGMDIRPAR